MGVLYSKVGENHKEGKASHKRREKERGEGCAFVHTPSRTGHG